MAHHFAGVAELADALDSGSSALYGRGGSSPFTRILLCNAEVVQW
jgi:hypothetical protein